MIDFQTHAPRRHRVGIVDYGSGNFTSVWNAMTHLGIDVLRIEHPEDLHRVERIVLPGVGSFPHAMTRMREMGMVDALREQVLESGKPFLGICVGMQILAALGHEFETCEGLGYVPGEVARFAWDDRQLPIPHMGWNEVSPRRASPLFDSMDGRPTFYFVHSYRFLPTDPDHTLATCEYGDAFCACVQRDHVYGVQFHPEKSQRDGLRLLHNFAELV